MSQTRPLLPPPTPSNLTHLAVGNGRSDKLRRRITVRLRLEPRSNEQHDSPAARETHPQSDPLPLVSGPFRPGQANMVFRPKGKNLH